MRGGCSSTLFREPESLPLDQYPLHARVLVIHLVHRRDVVKPTDNVRAAKTLAGLHSAAMELLNEADVSALMTPRLRDLRPIKRHPCKPRARLAIEFHLICPNHALRHRRVAAIVQKLFIRPEVRLERGRGSWFVPIAQIDLGERVTV